MILSIRGWLLIDFGGELFRGRSVFSGVTLWGLTLGRVETGNDWIGSERMAPSVAWMVPAACFDGGYRVAGEGGGGNGGQAIRSVAVLAPTGADGGAW